MSNSIFIHGRRWYYRLYNTETSKGLFNDNSLSSLSEKLLVQYEVPEGFKNVKRLYSVFSNHNEFLLYQEKFPIGERCFYESILGIFRQKPHFDIDFEGENEAEVGQRSKNLLQNLILSVSDILCRVGISLNPATDVLVYSSHGVKGNHYKRSYHLVINNYSHTNNDEARAFYDQVITNMSHCVDIDHIDHAVYGAIQQFRLLGSQKYGSNRPKCHDLRYEVNGVVYEHQFSELQYPDICRFYESLVTFVVDCKPLPSFIKVKKSAIICTDVVLTDDNVQNLEDMVNTHPFTADNCAIREIRGSLVVLDRTKSSLCPICGRVHDGDNPFLSVHKTGEVFFHCRRKDEGGRLLMTNIVITPEEQIEEEQIEQEEEEKPPSLVPVNFAPLFEDKYDVKLVSEKLLKKNKGICLPSVSSTPTTKSVTMVIGLCPSNIFNP